MRQELCWSKITRSLWTLSCKLCYDLVAEYGFRFFTFIFKLYNFSCENIVPVIYLKIKLIPKPQQDVKKLKLSSFQQQRLVGSSSGLLGSYQLG